MDDIVKVLTEQLSAAQATLASATISKVESEAEFSAASAAVEKYQAALAVFVEQPPALAAPAPAPPAQEKSVTPTKPLPQPAPSAPVFDPRPLCSCGGHFNLSSRTLNDRQVTIQACESCGSERPA